MNYRFYSIVAGLYLSDLQKGLQTAHAVSEVFTEVSKTFATAGALEAFKD
jgi:short subunit fatty acids transporter